MSEVSITGVKNNTSEVTVIGLGAMGAALAQALLGNGHRVTVWNRTSEKAESLVGDGAVIATDVVSAVGASPVVVVCVLDYEAAYGILETEEVTSALAGKILVQLTTGSPQDARDGAAWARERGVEYLDGAILAVPSQMGKAESAIVASGADTAFQKSEPLLRSMAGNVTYLGEQVGSAAALDLALLSHLFGAMLGFFHGARILESEGLPVDLLGSMITDLAPTVGLMVKSEADAIQAESYENPESSLVTCALSMELALKQARDAGINTEFPTFATSLFRKGMAAGYANEKPAALIKIMRGLVNPESPLEKSKTV